MYERRTHNVCVQESLKKRVNIYLIIYVFVISGDSVTYEEIIDFLLEFKVIANGKICTERQVTILIQSLFPKVIIKPSVKHNMVYVNLENRSDDVVKEELVGVTTEPIVENEATLEAKAWIQEEPEGYQSDEEENAELSFIEKEKHCRDMNKAPGSLKSVTPSLPAPGSLKSVTISLPNSSIPVPKPELSRSNSITGKSNSQTERSNSVTENKLDAVNKETVIERGIDVPLHLPQSIITKDEKPAKQQPNKNEELLNNDLFRRRTQSATLNRTSSFNRPKSVNGHYSQARDVKKDNTATSTKATLQRNRSFTKSTDQSFVGSIREKFRSSKSKHKELDQPKEKVKKKETLKSSKSFSVKEEKAKPWADKASIARAASTNDIHSSFRSQTAKKSSFSKSSADISKKHNDGIATNDVKKPSAITKKNFVESNRTQTKPIDARSSFRKPKEDENAFQKASVRNSLRFNSTEGQNRVKNLTSPKPIKSSQKVKRRNSTRETQNSSSSSTSSSNSSTPNLSRENSNTSFNNNTKSKRHTRAKEVPQQEKDFVRIAKAFQKATKTIDIAKDNIEKFMIVIATEELVKSTNHYLNLDDLYDHIHHRMIVSKDEIFNDHQSDDVTVDMSRYFDLLFKVLASHFDRIGCEMLTDPVTKEKVCYLTHVQINDYHLASIREGEIEDMIASYV